jgi:hypothetical protein
MSNIQTEIIPFTINSTGIYYYNNKDLKTYKPHFFYGFQSDPKNIITKKNIPENDYVYSCFDKRKGWSIYDKTCKRAQLLITKSWVDKFYFNKSDIPSTTTTENLGSSDRFSGGAMPDRFSLRPPSTPLPEGDLSDSNTTKNKEPFNTKEVDLSTSEIEVAPALLVLDDADKFKDTKGKILNIETRGEREKDRNNIFFKVKDVSTSFNMPNLDIVLNNKDKCYNRNIHYKTFYTTTLTNGVSSAYKKCLYLTYKGLLKVLFASRTGNAEKFQDWAEEKLFTCQMGSTEEKEVLVSEVMNMDVANVRAMFNKYASTFPCIYLLSLGLVKDLKQTFNIGDDVDGSLMVYKFGRTEDFERRLFELQKQYGKMRNVCISVVFFHTIDIKYLSEAETSVNQFCTNFSKRLLVENYKELVIFNSTELREVKNQYKMLGDLYMGATAGLQKQIGDLKHENEVLVSKHNAEICLLKLEASERKLEIQTLQHKLEFNDMKHKYDLLLASNK